jgi:hypothetical protein
MVMEVLKDTCSLVESLSGPSMIKNLEQINMKTISCIHSRVVFFLYWGNRQLAVLVLA